MQPFGCAQPLVSVGRPGRDGTTRNVDGLLVHPCFFFSFSPGLYVLFHPHTGPVPTSWGALARLVVLGLERNDLAGPLLPAVVNRWSSLEELRLGGNLQLEAWLDGGGGGKGGGGDVKVALSRLPKLRKCDVPLGP